MIHVWATVQKSSEVSVKHIFRVVHSRTHQATLYIYVCSEHWFSAQCQNIFAAYANGGGGAEKTSVLRGC